MDLQEKKVYTVSELTASIKTLLKQNFTQIYVKGEISGVKFTADGNCFFSLKDENALLNGVIFKRDLDKIKFKLENGLKVTLLGTISVYEKNGRYNIITKEVIPQGKGELQLAFEQLKNKLEKEGLFREGEQKTNSTIPTNYWSCYFCYRCSCAGYY